MHFAAKLPDRQQRLGKSYLSDMQSSAIVALDVPTRPSNIAPLSIQDSSLTPPLTSPKLR